MLAQQLLAGTTIWTAFDHGRPEWRMNEDSYALHVFTIVWAFGSLQTLLLYLKTARLVGGTWGAALVPLWIFVGVCLLLGKFAHAKYIIRTAGALLGFLVPFFCIAVPAMVIAPRLDRETAALEDLGLHSPGAVVPHVIEDDAPYAFAMIPIWIVGIPALVLPQVIFLNAAAPPGASSLELCKLGSLFFCIVLSFVLSLTVAAADGQILAGVESGSSWHGVLWPAYVLPAVAGLAAHLLEGSSNDSPHY
jgi:hypothetical protein